MDAVYSSMLCTNIKQSRRDAAPAAKVRCVVEGVGCVTGRALRWLVVGPGTQW